MLPERAGVCVALSAPRDLTDVGFLGRIILHNILLSDVKVDYCFHPLSSENTLCKTQIKQNVNCILDIKILEKCKHNELKCALGYLNNGSGYIHRCSSQCVSHLIVYGWVSIEALPHWSEFCSGAWLCLRRWRRLCCSPRVHRRKASPLCETSDGSSGSPGESRPYSILQTRERERGGMDGNID